VTHLDVSADDVEDASERIRTAVTGTARPVDVAADAPTPY
jgi:hypothetical protein